MDLSQSYFQTLALAATYNSGTVITDSNGTGLTRVLLNRTVRDTDDNAGKGIQETLVLNSQNQQLQLLSSSPSLAKGALQSLSPSGKKELCFANNKSAAGGDPVPIVEIVHHASSEWPYGNVKLDLSGVHGAIVGDTWFGGISWSHDEVYAVYVAKLKVPKKITAVESVAAPTTSSAPSAERNMKSESAANKFDFIDDWGEKYVDVCNLGIFMLNTLSGLVTALPDVDVNQWTIGQPQFIPPTSSQQETESPSQHQQYRIVYTAWSTVPRRLGMIYCYQRPCSIFLADVSALLQDDAKSDHAPSITHHLVSRNILLARSPRAAPDGKSLIFLGSRHGYLTHGGCSELFRVSLENDAAKLEAEVVIAQVNLPTSTTSVNALATTALAYEKRRQYMSFPGLYLDQLPQRCFANTEGTRIVCSSLWGSIEEIVLVDIINKEITPLSSLYAPLEDIIGLASLQVLDVSLSVSSPYVNILFTYSAPNAPVRANLLSLNYYSSASSILYAGPSPRLFSISNKVNLFPALSTNDLSNTSKKTLDIGDLLVTLHEKISFQIFFHQDANGIPFESILIAPTSASTSLPLILVPHGGPHSCFSTAFVSAYIYLSCTLNAAILYVNYRGSTGFGQDSIESLAGTIGTNDVQDMMTCLQHALSLPHPSIPGQPLLDAKQVAVCGGSHGGFLGAHLSAQYPDVFQAAALRNPVTDIAAMVSVSDIPDWCYVESLGVSTVAAGTANGTINWSNPSPAVDHLVRMRQVSPVAVPSVTSPGMYRTPTLICLGMKDRRVPPAQGVAYYQLLRLYHGSRIPLSLMTFPEDVHAIDLPATEAEHWIAIAKWFQTYLVNKKI